MDGRRIALPGITSFTGLWIAAELLKKKYVVSGLCSRNENDYKGTALRRVLLLKSLGADLHFNTKVNQFEAWITRFQPQIWINHHHHMENFRSPDYDVAKADEIGLTPLKGIVRALKMAGCKGIIFSGSYFEPGEGGQDIDAVVTPYSQSKRRVWLELRKLCFEANLKVTKIVIPNPIGPLENSDRLIPCILKKSAKKEIFELATPSSLAVNLPVNELAKVYATCIQQYLAGGSPDPFLRPSCAQETNLHFVKRVLRDLVSKELKIKACEIKVAAPEKPPTDFNNGPDLIQHIDWPNFWKWYGAQLPRKPGPRK